MEKYSKLRRGSKLKSRQSQGNKAEIECIDKNDSVATFRFLRLKNTEFEKKFKLDRNNFNLSYWIFTK